MIEKIKKIVSNQRKMMNEIGSEKKKEEMEEKIEMKIEKVRKVMKIEKEKI